MRSPFPSLYFRNAIALAVNNQKAAGRIYNVSESPRSELDLATLTRSAAFHKAATELVKAIAKIIGWQGKVEVLPKTQMPNNWNFLTNFDQH